MIEWLEVFINSILYIRNVYPESIFRKRRIYNIPVNASIFPPVNDYIRSVLQSARYLLTEDKLFRLEVLIYKNTNEKDQTKQETIESYCCEFLTLTKDDRDSYLFDFEDNVKSALLFLEERVKNLPRLPRTCRFKILLQTTRAAFIQLTNQNELCDFLWYREDAEIGATGTGINESKVQILPLTKIDKMGIQMFVEKHGVT